MTCCIAYKTDNKLYFIADMAGTDGDGVQEHRVDPKVFRRNNILFATDGSFRMRDVLMYNLKIPHRLEKEKLSSKGYLVRKLIPAIKKCFEENDVYIKNEETDKGSPGNILIGIDDKIFKVECDFQVGEVSYNYNAIGDGSREALAALDMYGALRYYKYPTDDKEVESMLSKAMNIASLRNANVGYQYITLTQEYNQGDINV